MKKLGRILLLVLAALLAAALAYGVYVFAAYYRLDDNLALDVQNDPGAPAPVNGTFTILTWNVGFGAYSSDYSFFMDGGTESRAFSADAVRRNIAGDTALTAGENPDFLFLQETDTDSDRSYHIDETALFRDALPGMGSVFAQNFDSPYLFYPLLNPHGKSRSGLMTFTRYQASGALRRSLPIETGFTKLLDLDRCYCVTRVELDSGRTLCLYNVHLSAYSSDGSINTAQLNMLASDMLAAYQAGNYVICGGDFNMDLLGDSASVFGVDGGSLSWARSFPAELLPEGLRLVSSLDPADPVPSCRNANEPYTPGHTFVLTVDGFIVSDNVRVSSVRVLDRGFATSDHNPVEMRFALS